MLPSCFSLACPALSPHLENPYFLPCPSVTWKAIPDEDRRGHGLRQSAIRVQSVEPVTVTFMNYCPVKSICLCDSAK
uniref:Secreted protein n=1 Tax=Steinernema glaseri TaxID=37863 RepID=A0A1I7Z793_9BILA